MAKEEKPRILLLSDMWGKNRLEWLPAFTELLTPHFKVDFKDCSELAEIDLPIFVEDALHYEYVRWGIDRAVKNLCELDGQYDALLGFSMGGVIGWKALLRNGLNVKHYYGVSATRLRYETRKPQCPIRLYFGDEDLHAPDINWEQSMSLKALRFGGGHEMYYHKVAARFICNHVYSDLRTPLKEPIILRRKK